MHKISIINGPNMNLLGKREVGIYGKESLEQLIQYLTAEAHLLNAVIVHFQSNYEGEIVDYIQNIIETCHGIVINPSSLSMSYPIREAISGTRLPAIEVHMSNIYAREAWHANSAIVPCCIGQIVGFGQNSYSIGLKGLVNYLQKSKQVG